MKRYMIQYKIENYGGSISLVNIEPASEYVDNLFWTGAILYNTCLDNDGEYRMYINLYDNGEFDDLLLEKYVGWQEVND